MLQYPRISFLLSIIIQVEPMFAYEDFVVGKPMPFGPYTVSKEEIIEFSEEFDPQPFHLNEEDGKNTQAGGLIASGWHTCSILMRMMCDAYLNNSLSQGAPGIDEVKWLNPVRPGDILSGHSIVTEKRVSRSRPEIGIFTIKHEVFNQNAETVLTIENSGMMGLRNPASVEVRG